MTRNYSKKDPKEAVSNEAVSNPKKQAKPADISYQGGEVPGWVREVIEAHLAIEAEDAKSAGALGFMTRALVIATMPYKDPKVDSFVRQNGKFRLRILAGYEGGIPYGVYPRLLMSWVATEAVRTKSPMLELGDSLSHFLRDVLGLQRGGGARGSSTRVVEQMKRLFGSIVTAQYSGDLQGSRGFLLRNVVLADEVKLNESTFEKNLEEQLKNNDNNEGVLWVPQKENAGKWKSELRLSQQFFNECVERPVPIDLRAYKALRGSPLAMDIYTWMTYRMSYTNRATRPIPWEALMGQFGSSYTTESATRDFKRAFLNALKAVQIVYPAGKVRVEENGLVLLPSKPHIAARQPDLF